jgi:hypothetical protein
MSPPPTSIDGTDITGATIDGQEVQEITIDGQTVFSPGPPDAGDLQARYDAREISLADGDPVNTWEDLSGNGFDMSPVDSSPTYRTSQVQGQDAVRFDSNDLKVSWPTVSESYHIFGLVKIFGFSGSGNDDTIWDGANREEHRFATRPDETGNPFKIIQNITAQGVSPDTNARVYDTLFKPSGNNDILNVDGSQTLSKDLGSQASNGYTLGARPNNGVDEKSQIDVVEVLFYTKDKSSKATEIREFLDRNTSLL